MIGLSKRLVTCLLWAVLGLLVLASTPNILRSAHSKPQTTPTAALPVARFPPPSRPVPLPTLSPVATTGITSTAVLSLDVVPEPVKPVVFPRGAVNIALLGVDTRPSSGGANTDAILIASLNPDPPIITLLAIPRDVLVYIPGQRMAKVNTAFARGWWTFRQTLRYNFGLRVDYYVKANFKGLVRVVDLLDGIEVVSPCPVNHVFPADPYYMPDPENPLVVREAYTNTFTGEVWQAGQLVPTLTIDLPRPGVYRLNGLQTLAYIRARKDIPNGDLDRGRRMQYVLQAIVLRARARGALTLVQLPALIQQLSADVETNLELDQLLALAQFVAAPTPPTVRVRYFEPVGLTGINLVEVGSALVPNRANIHPYLQRVFAVPRNQQALAGVPMEVRNGTGDAGFGRAAIVRLRELGFDVTDAGDAERVYPHTIVVDRTTTSKGSALHLLKQVGVKEENIKLDPAPEGPRYQIILGQDFEPCYWRSAARQISRDQAAPTPAPTSTLTPP